MCLCRVPEDITAEGRAATAGLAEAGRAASAATVGRVAAAPEVSAVGRAAASAADRTIDRAACRRSWAAGDADRPLAGVAAAA